MMWIQGNATCGASSQADLVQDYFLSRTNIIQLLSLFSFFKKIGVNSHNS